MKRILIILALIIVVYFGIATVTNGFQSEALNLDIASYKALEEKSNSLTMSVSLYNTKNDVEFEAETSRLTNAVKKYKNSKARYDELIKELEAQGNLADVVEEKIIYSTKEIYNVDFLQTVIGNYANKESLELTLSLQSSEYTDPLATAQDDFTVCDLRFMVTGPYINIANFLYHLEEDSKLEFEIRDYNMGKQEADFTVYGLRISNSSLLTVQSEDQEENVTEDGTTTNTDNSNTTSVTGSTSTTPTTQNTNTATEPTPGTTAGVTQNTNTTTTTTAQ